MKGTSLRPTGNLLPVVLLLAATWYAGASQGNGAAYLLCFLIVSVVVVSAVHAWFNLSGLRLSVEAVRPGFAGREIPMPVEVLSDGRRARFGLDLSLGGGHVSLPEIRPGAAVRAEVLLPAGHRGLHRVRWGTLGSRFPLGLFQMARRVPVDREYLVYPQPSGDGRLPPAPVDGSSPPNEGGLREGDDFAGVRPYILGESQRHVDWKAVARGQALLIKQFAGQSQDRLEFDWVALPHLDYEARISQLARWVIEAERLHATYRLRLPSETLPSSGGQAHYHRCLRALALMPGESV